MRPPRRRGNTDALCQARKKRLPVIPEFERIQIMESIRYVDQMVRQTSSDKMAAWEALRFDVMFVGEDGNGTDVWNKLEHDFDPLGVDIVYFRYTTHTSSTILRRS